MHALSAHHWDSLSEFLKERIDENGHVRDSLAWKKLYDVLKQAAQMQNRLRAKQQQQEPFQRYAKIYDAVIGQPCLEGFMANYLKVVQRQWITDFARRNILSLGCGTGLVEAHILEAFHMNPSQVYGIDVSAGMVEQARKRIRADVMDLLQFEGQTEQWDLVYCGLNVFHYLPPDQLEAAIAKSASFLKSGGYFLGDFITTDHVRWYPNVIFSADEQVVSLRDPVLVESEGKMYQESEIFNIHKEAGELWINYAGKHRRFLPPMWRIRSLFERYFKGKVQLFDAHSMEAIGRDADTCPSTRYVMLANR
ncbi:MAG: class I SAM-dependent methyltransferase [Bacteroidota bacterium]